MTTEIINHQPENPILTHEIDKYCTLTIVALPEITPTQPQWNTTLELETAHVAISMAAHLKGKSRTNLNNQEEVIGSGDYLSLLLLETPDYTLTVARGADAMPAASPGRWRELISLYGTAFEAKYPGINRNFWLHPDLLHHHVQHDFDTRDYPGAKSFIYYAKQLLDGTIQIETKGNQNHPYPNLEHALTDLQWILFRDIGSRLRDFNNKLDLDLHLSTPPETYGISLLSWYLNAISGQVMILSLNPQIMEQIGYPNHSIRSYFASAADLFAMYKPNQPKVTPQPPDSNALPDNLINQLSHLPETDRERLLLEKPFTTYGTYPLVTQPLSDLKMAYSSRMRQFTQSMDNSTQTSVQVLIASDGAIFPNRDRELTPLDFHEIDTPPWYLLDAITEFGPLQLSNQLDQAGYNFDDRSALALKLQHK